jgi:hypothetical protein
MKTCIGFCQDRIFAQSKGKMGNCRRFRTTNTQSIISLGRGSLIKKTHAPPGPETQQIWVKRLGPAAATADDDGGAGSGGAPMAVLFVNAGPTNSSADFGVSLAELGITGGATVRNIWKFEDEQPIAAGASLNVSGVKGHSSRFFKLTPK